MDIQTKKPQKGLVNLNRQAVNKQVVEMVKARIAAREIPDRESLAYAIANSRHLLFNFLMDNNLPSINGILNIKLGENVDFLPNRSQIEGIIASYIRNGENEKIQTILDNFRFNKLAQNYTTDPGNLAEISKQLKIQM